MSSHPMPTDALARKLQRALPPRSATPDRAGAHRDPCRRPIRLADASRGGGRLHPRRHGQGGRQRTTQSDPAHRRWIPDAAAAEKAFVNARSRSAQDAAWIDQVGLVEHHHNGHWLLRGMSAGHYLDVDEALHVSERGGAEGFATGAALGALLGPPGLAAGRLLGSIIGSQTAHPNEHDPQPRLLGEQLRGRLSSSGSAIALIAQTADADAMLTTIGATEANVVRRSLTADEVGSLEVSLRSTPLASPGRRVTVRRTFMHSRGPSASRMRAALARRPVRAACRGSREHAIPAIPVSCDVTQPTS
jgi:hypothetical protein